MIYVLTVILYGQFYQSGPVDPFTCHVLRAHNVSLGASHATCEWVEYVAA